MNRLFTTLTVSIFVFVLLACQPKNICELSETEKAAIEQEVETIVRNFLNAETLSFETHSGLRANQPGYLFSGEGKIKYRTYSEYEAFVKDAFSKMQRFTEMSVSELYVYALSENAATCTTVFNSKFLTISGDTVINDGCWTMVFKKFDGNWKIIQENGTHLYKR